jgi:hypothetical protein
MASKNESTGYRETILSELQRAWRRLGDLAVEYRDFEGCNRAILHINEATSWEVVRDLKKMAGLIGEIRKICTRGKADKKVMEQIENVDGILERTLSEIED